MRNVVGGALILAVFGMVLVGSIIAGSNHAGGSVQADGLGRLAEVVVRAEMPRLVMDTVQVNAVRDVAALPVPSFVN